MSVVNAYVLGIQKRDQNWGNPLLCNLNISMIRTLNFIHILEVQFFFKPVFAFYICVSHVKNLRLLILVILICLDMYVASVASWPHSLHLWRKKIQKSHGCFVCTLLPPHFVCMINDIHTIFLICQRAVCWPLHVGLRFKQIQ